MSIYLGSTTLTYNYLNKSGSKALDQHAKEPLVKNEIAHFEAQMGKIKTVDAFVKNYRVFNFAMKAYGLEDMAYAKAYMKKVLTSDLSDKASFANKLSDARFTNFAKAFGYLNGTSLATAASPSDVVKAYVQQSMEDDLGATDQGVKLALYFKRMAPTVKSAYGLLADNALWQVTKTVYGFPTEMGLADIDQQAKAVKARLNIADLQDPAKLDKILKRFTIMWDATQNTATNPTLQLFTSGRTAGSGFTSSLINLKYGG